MYRLMHRYTRFHDVQVPEFEWPDRWVPITIICKDDDGCEETLCDPKHISKTGKIRAHCEDDKDTVWTIHCVNRNTGFYVDANVFLQFVTEDGWVLEIIATRGDSEAIGVIWTHTEAQNVCKWIPPPLLFQS
jgi:hypothetical protein